MITKASRPSAEPSTRKAPEERRGGAGWKEAEKSFRIGNRGRSTGRRGRRKRDYTYTKKKNVLKKKEQSKLSKGERQKVM